MGSNGNNGSSNRDIVESSSALAHIDLSKPRYDQSRYTGRAKHFLETVSPLNVLVSKQKLSEAAELVKAHKNGRTPSGTTEEQLWAAKRLYDSAYHPDTGELMFLPGRMSFQVPGNMVITGCVLTFFKHPAAVVFWQFANQTFNSVANYTNRSGDEVALRDVLVPYFAASTTATLTALTLNKVVAKRVPPLVARLVPFTAIAAANCINIPLIRQRELKQGIAVYDHQERQLAMSKAAARKGIREVVVSRILMALPAMVIPPIVMNAIEKKGFLKRFPWTSAPLQILLVGFCLTFTTPLCCALFPQRSSIAVNNLESEVRNSLQKEYPSLTRVYFNKGL